MTFESASSSSPVLRPSVSFNLTEATIPELHLRTLPEKSTRRSSQGIALTPSSPPCSRAEDGADHREEDSDHSAVNDPESSILRGILAHYNPMLVLENSGSVARDHLASERTFLAYVRTSLAIASAGVALVQLFTISSSSGSEASALAKKYARPLGSVSVCLGIAVLLIGILRYFTVQQALTRGKFPVARLMIGGIALTLLAIVTAIFAALVTGHR